MRNSAAAHAAVETTLLRPSCLARYSATSARLSTSATGSPLWSSVARPIEIVTSIRLVPLLTANGFAGDRAAQALGDHAGDVQVGLRHHDHEFLAAIAAGEIDAADRLADAHREFAQHVVAGVVAIDCR